MFTLRWPDVTALQVFSQNFGLFVLGGGGGGCILQEMFQKSNNPLKKWLSFILLD